MKKEKKFVFRIDSKTLGLLRMLEEKTGNAKSVIVRNLIWEAAKQLDEDHVCNHQNVNQE